MTDAIRFRRGSAADRQAILSLRRKVFGDVDPEKLDPAFWDWSFRDGYAGEGLVFVAESDDRVIGHVAFVPQRYSTPAGAADGALAVDAMVDPAFHRRGVFSGLTRFSADELSSRVAFCVGLQIRKASLGGMLAGGWSLIDRVPVLMKPLSVRNIARDFGFTLRVGASRDPNSDPHVREITTQDLRQFDRIDAKVNAQERTASFARWRYDERPGTAYRIDGWFEDGAVRAFAVHRMTTLKGMRTLAIVDAGSLDDRSLGLLVRALCRSNRGEAALAAALMSHAHPARRALASAGFFAGPYRFNLLVQVFDERYRAAATAPWALSWGDTDHV